MAYYILKSYKLKVDPFEVFTALSRERHCFFLDTNLKQNNAGARYSFLGSEPFLILKAEDTDPFAQLREALDKFRVSLPRCKIPFLGGAVGYLSYDLGLGLEKKIKPKVKLDPMIPGSFFAFYNTLVIIDHLKDELYILALGFPEKNYRAAKLLAERNFKRTYQLLSGINNLIPAQALNQGRFLRSGLNSNFSKQGYIEAIKRAKEYIRRGDIYQVNLAQQYQARTSLSALQIYCRLRQTSPAHFSAYFDAQDFQVLSSSPEGFLKLEGDIVTTRPMKGTRPRSKDKRKDRQLKNELLKSAKDKAELLMIVDLERNDLGRVCNYNSIKVNTLRQIECYRTVFQTTATISGRLHKDKDRLDLLRACFPGGSITGCPKIRAMEIIDELEPDRRSIYTGCLGYLSFSGQMDFNILIRSILKKKNQLYFGSGGGIVADSQPEEEYEETLTKARGMIEAISA